MKPPSIESTLSGYNFSFPDEEISIDVSGLLYQRGSLKGEVKIGTSRSDYNPHLHQANFNFSSTRAKSELVKTLSQICKEIQWESLIEYLRVRTLELFREGNPLETISSKGELRKIEYLLYPLLPKGQLSFIYADGACGKSTLALFLTLLIQTRENAVRYGFSMNGNAPSKSLYLDWKTDSDIMEYQFKKLCKGLGTETDISYRRCDLPLVDDLENIKRKILSCNADVVIIDSAGLASGDLDLSAPQTANIFSLKLRTLKTTNFVIGHTSKDKGDKKTIFGSAFWFNNSRNVWEVKKIQSEGDDYIDIGLFHRKCNFSKLHTPLGFRFTYQDDSITVTSQKVSELGEFEKDLPLRQRIKKILFEEGLMTAKQIALRLEIGEAVVRSRLNEMRSKGITIKQDGQWAIYHKGYSNE